MGAAFKAYEASYGKGCRMRLMGDLDTVPPDAGFMQALVNLAVQRWPICLGPSRFERGIGGGATIAAGPVTCGQRHGVIKKEQGCPAPLGLRALIAPFGVLQCATDPMGVLPACGAELAILVKPQDPAIARQHSARPNGNDLARWLYAVLKGGGSQIINSFVALSLTSG